MARRRVSLEESFKTTFENAPSGPGNPLTETVLCVLLGMWWWLTGIPESATAPNGAADPAAARQTTARATAKDGWYQLDGRWYCEMHDGLYCKQCSS